MSERDPGIIIVAKTRASLGVTMPQLSYYCCGPVRVTYKAAEADAMALATALAAQQKKET